MLIAQNIIAGMFYPGMKRRFIVTRMTEISNVTKWTSNTYVGT